MESLQVSPLKTSRESVLVLALSGDLDYDTQQTLSDTAVLALDDGCRQLIVECSRVTFCDSEGLNALLQLRQEAEGRGVILVLAAISAVLRHVLDLTHALQILTLADTVEQAVRLTGTAVVQGHPGS
ncbi:STAS domain-containing protein [Streptomyces sp. NPDC006733]|uniref:STAS domain-containing protein n=1 Tax=Streptomyces sp. NPDC006733 TaxID=3155460 RepID=UPI0033E6E1A1